MGRRLSRAGISAQSCPCAMTVNEPWRLCRTAFNRLSIPGDWVCSCSPSRCRLISSSSGLSGALSTKPTTRSARRISALYCPVDRGRRRCRVRQVCSAGAISQPLAGFARREPRCLRDRGTTRVRGRGRYLVASRRREWATAREHIGTTRPAAAAPRSASGRCPAVRTRNERNSRI